MQSFYLQDKIGQTNMQLSVVLFDWKPRFLKHFLFKLLITEVCRFVFSFQKVFDQSTKQDEVFELVSKPVVDKWVDNWTAFLGTIS